MGNNVQAEEEIGEPGNLELNLCELLDIDVEGLALKIAMGIDPWEEKENTP